MIKSNKEEISHRERAAGEQMRASPRAGKRGRVKKADDRPTVRGQASTPPSSQPITAEKRQLKELHHLQPIIRATCLCFQHPP